MSGLFDSLSIATSGLTANRTGLDVVGQNIANVNTPGYARRTLSLAELAPTDARSAGRGVEVVQIQANRDALVEARLGHEQAGQSYDQALLSGLSDVEAAVGVPGASIDANLQAFFDAFSQLANDVTSTSARDGVV
jgi:flagellar hook-associated protein 1